MILIFHVHPLVSAAYSVGRNYVISIEDGSVVLRKIKNGSPGMTELNQFESMKILKFLALQSAFLTFSIFFE